MPGVPPIFLGIEALQARIRSVGKNREWKIESGKWERLDYERIRPID